MPKPYSLRERVVSYVEARPSLRAAAAHFRVSPSFVINLMTTFSARGPIAPKALGGWRHSKLEPAPRLHLAPRGRKERHHLARSRTPSRLLSESRPRLAVVLADPQRLEL